MPGWSQGGRSPPLPPLWLRHWLLKGEAQAEAALAGFVNRPSRPVAQARALFATKSWGGDTGKVQWANAHEAGVLGGGILFKIGF